MDPCNDCGGWGNNLVRANGLCNHCIRKSNALDATLLTDFIRKQIDRGFVDISAQGNYEILKRVSKPGQLGGELPENGCPAKVQFVSKIWDDEEMEWNTIVETTRDVVQGKHIGGTDDPYEVRLGRYNKDWIEEDERRVAFDPQYISFGRCKAWDIAILTMRKGEIAEFVCSPRLAYGKNGIPPKVLPDTPVLFEFELVEWGESIPALPSREELEMSRLDREQEERKNLEENPPPSLAERIAMSNKEREVGNNLFQKKQYCEAKQSYDRGFVSIYFSDKDLNFVLNDDEREAVLACKLPLHLNRAMCKLKLGKMEDGLWDCNKALEIDPDNVKGLYRRCIIHTSLLEEELRKEERKEFWVVDKAWEIVGDARSDLKRLLQLEYPTLEEEKVKVDKKIVAARNQLKRLETRLVAYTREYERQRADLFKNKMWKKQGEDRVEALEEEEDVYADMPVLE
mmetsp:Transcript_20793/g.33929  ORF Transcript_20793/g.33929 Transcript_20793/m.33929 type:complete len:456 (-) Transcript_20793:228-1595(-)